MQHGLLAITTDAIACFADEVCVFQMLFTLIEIGEELGLFAAAGSAGLSMGHKS